MNPFITSLLYVPLTALLLTTARAQPTERALPLKGTIDSFETLDLSGAPTAAISTAAASGNATLLGSFAGSWIVVINFEALGGEAVGTGVLTAANGDKLFTSIVGHGAPTDDPDVVLITENSTIVGGTGRFEGASGSYVRHSLSNLVTGYTSGRFSGTVLLPYPSH